MSGGNGLHPKIFLAQAKMIHWVILCETADASATCLSTWESPLVRGWGGGINCTNRRYKCPGKSFFRFPKDEARKAIDFRLSSTFEVRRIARPPFVFLLSLFAAIVSPSEFCQLCRLERSAEPSSVLTVQLCAVAVRDEPS